MLKVVIADDEVKICKLLGVIIDWENLGFEIVSQVHNGDDLLDAVHTYVPDVVITDIRMPGKSGLEILHGIRELSQDIDVIIISGHRDFEYVRTALSDGAIDYILKPIDKDNLINALTKIKEKRKISDFSRDIVQFVHKDLVKKILDGEISNGDGESLNSAYGCSFAKPALYFCVFKIDSEEITQDNVSLLIKDYIRSGIESKDHACHEYSCDNMIYCLVDGSEDASDLVYDVNGQRLQVFDKYISQGMGHVSVGVSKVLNGELKKALNEAEDAVYNQIFHGVDRVLVYKKEESTKDDFSISRNDKEGLIRAMESVNKSEINKFIQNSLSTIKEKWQHHKSGTQIHNDIIGLQETLNEALRSVYDERAIVEIPEKYTYFLQNCFSFEKFVKTFEEEADEICEEIVLWQEAKEKVPVRKIKNYINAHYMEDVTLDVLAAETGLSTSYISRLFSKEMDLSFVSYLNKVRIGKVKSLLSSTDLSLSEVGIRCGFNDEKYLMRQFKKETGLTAGEYRKLYGE